MKCKEGNDMRVSLVRDWMTRDVIVVEPDTLVSDADDLLVTHKIRRLPVVENGRLVGIITYGDILSARPSTANHLNSWEMQYMLAQLVVDVMSTAPITVSQDVPMAKAAQLMLHHKVSSLPVVTDDNALVGIITESDIFRMVVRDWVHACSDISEPQAHYG